MAKKRHRLEILHDILQVVKEKSGTIRATHIMYKSNLSFQSMQECLTELLDKNFLEEHINKKNVRTYSITKQGLQFLSKYNEIKDFVDSFGV